MYMGIHVFPMCCIYYVAYNQVTWPSSVLEKAHLTLLVHEVNSHGRAHILWQNSSHPKTGRSNPNSHWKNSRGPVHLPYCLCALFGRLLADMGQNWARDCANSWMVRMSLKNNLAQALNCSICLNEHHFSHANGNKAQQHAITARLEDTCRVHTVHLLQKRTGPHNTAFALKLSPTLTKRCTWSVRPLLQQSETLLSHLVSLWKDNLPFWSACGFHHWSHPISIEALCFAEVDDIENYSLGKKKKSQRKEVRYKKSLYVYCIYQLHKNMWRKYMQ